MVSFKLITFIKLVVEARGLLNKDMFGGKTNPFVVLKFGNQEFASRVIKSSLAPAWNQTFALYVFAIYYMLP